MENHHLSNVDSPTPIIQEDSLDSDEEQEISSPSGDNSFKINIVDLGESKNKVSKKSFLFEVCAANYWNPPKFECVKEEGPGHSKLFTFKVTVETSGASKTILECFGSPKPKKKAAEEDAAEGALWFLEKRGFFHKRGSRVSQMFA